MQHVVLKGCFGLFCVLFNASHLSLPGYGGFKVPNDDAGFCKKLKEKHLERGKTHLGAEITNTRHEYVKLLCSGKGRYLLIYPHVALKCVLRWSDHKLDHMGADLIVPMMQREWMWSNWPNYTSGGGQGSTVTTLSWQGTAPNKRGSIRELLSRKRIHLFSLQLCTLFKTLVEWRWDQQQNKQTQ